MSIPTINHDMAIIQKLSDLPNSTEGLTADELKAKFDEAALAIQKWINETLVPAIKAENIPFTGSAEIDGDTLDAAIRAVHAQVRDAATGTIVNGSVTMEKLSEELLARVFGGRAWVSMDEPNSEQNPGSGFPVGQIWLRPSFTAVNAAETNWTASGCTVDQAADRLTVTGNGTVTTAAISQNLSGLGQDGDRVYVLFSVENRDSELTGLTASLNGGEEQDATNGVFTGNLSGGLLTVKLSATWPSTSLAVGSFDVVNYTVVNIDQILRQTSDAKELSNWAAYLAGLLPLTEHTTPAEVWMQKAAGDWWQMGFSLLPVSRGGTGLSSISAGALLYGGGDGLTELPASAEDGSFLQLVDGKPKWQSVEDAAASGSILRVLTGSYTGNGSAKTVTLPVEPKLINISTASGGYAPATPEQSLLRDRPATIGQGCKDTQPYTVSASGSYSVKFGNVTLDGAKLVMDSPYFCNRSGVVYLWTAIY